MSAEVIYHRFLFSPSARNHSFSWLPFTRVFALTSGILYTTVEAFLIITYDAFYIEWFHYKLHSILLLTHFSEMVNRGGNNDDGPIKHVQK